jgi:hypothetical protein
MKGLTDRALMILGLAIVAAVMAVPPALASSNAGLYGSLDPWAYNAIHAAGSPTEVITEHSAGQNPAVGDSGRYGSLDPWAYAAIHASAAPADLITEHSAGQNRIVRLAGLSSVTATDGAQGFSFRDAGIGAAAAVAAMTVLTTSLVVRRRRVVQAL